MYKLIIADDELIIRQHLLKAIDWEALGFEIVADVSDGKSLYEKTKELSPDAVLIDIRMPIMTGIEYTKKIREEGLGTKIVALSGYSDSEYLLEMLNLNISAYILKPCKNTQLTETFTKLASELHESDKTTGIKHSEAIRQYLSDGDSEHFSEVFPNKNTNHALFRIYFDETPASQISVAAKNVFDCMNIIFDKYYIIEKNSSYIFFCIPSGEYDLTEASLQSAFMCINDTVTEECPDSSVSLCYIPVSDDWNYISSVCKNFPIYDNSKFIYGRKSFTNISEIKNISFSDDIFTSAETEKNLLNAIQSHCTDMINEHLRDFDNTLKNSATSMYGCKASYFRLINSIYHSLCEANTVTEAIKDICSDVFRKFDLILFSDSLFEFIYNLLVEISECLTTPDSTSTNLYYTAAVDFIDKNFTEDITMAQIANELDISYGYLSSIFKNNNNAGFVKLLRDRRIAEAKKLLVETNKKIYEISELTGFSNERYFSAVFKKATGTSPVKYRTTHKKEI